MWKLLLLLLSPRVDGDEPVDEPTEDEPVDEPTDDDPVDEPTDDEPVDDEPAPRESRAQREIRTLRERAQAAETKHAQALAELEAARRSPSPTAQPSEEQVIWQQEEEVLRNPEAQDWQKYAINAARAARQANANSQNALMRAEDLADRTRFEQLKLSKPKLYEAYADKVEERLAEIRKQGHNPQRSQLLALMIGEAMLEGKLKADAKSTPQGGAKRPSTPGAKSDVSSSGGGKMSDAEKRAKRLEGIRI